MYQKVFAVKEVSRRGGEVKCKFRACKMGSGAGCGKGGLVGGEVAETFNFQER